MILVSYVYWLVKLRILQNMIKGSNIELYWANHSKVDLRIFTKLTLFMLLQLPPHEPGVVIKAVNHFLQVCFLYVMSDGHRSVSIMFGVYVYRSWGWIIFAWYTSWFLSKILLWIFLFIPASSWLSECLKFQN